MTLIDIRNGEIKSRQYKISYQYKCGIFVRHKSGEGMEISEKVLAEEFDGFVKHLFEKYF